MAKRRRHAANPFHFGAVAARATRGAGGWAPLWPECLRIFLQPYYYSFTYFEFCLNWLKLAAQCPGRPM